MKVKSNFALKKIAGTWVVLPLKEQTLDFTGMLTLNESGCMLWQLLMSGCTRAELAQALVNEYEVSYDEALADVNEYVEKLTLAGCIDEE